ncbi:MAG TPA: Gfo/Idh/MocA family oxidoreductase [Verrucomicrobiae bacterium]|jgi:glucose-fructose oxidoreductase
MKPRHPSSHKIRYAVVGLGHIAQNAILPAFKHAGENSELAALVSDDPVKLRAMAEEYGVDNCFSYNDYELCLYSGEIDAVYIALPNNMHADFCVRAAEAGIHVLCEKPLAVTEDECHQIIEACADNGVKLMTAYRLHFERGNLEAINMVRSGKIGEPKIFNSVFTMQVAPGNIRTKDRYAGGTLYDIGIYCINAARYMFGDEPTEVFGLAASSNDRRFRHIEEMTSAIMRFPGERLGAFTTSFGASDTADFEVIGTKGRLRVIQAYDYSMPVILELTRDGKTRKQTFGLRDQFAPELIYFSDCIIRDREPEPSGVEGLIDVHIIRSMYHSVKKGVPVILKTLKRRQRPNLRQQIYRRRVTKPKLVHVTAPTK